jgi:hypothetical protein
MRSNPLQSHQPTTQNGLKGITEKGREKEEGEE